ncbi:MAG TPA: pirin family protein [Cytophagales bacterium]|nr:pirin family protein [Cytophagales bacterium]
MRKNIKKIHKAIYKPISDLETHSPLPSPELKQVDPFIFLNHHGPQVYPASNNGLPFGPHPHRGMETVTIIVEGDIMHKDSVGHVSVIEAGGVQWMTAGKGLIHAEVSSDTFKSAGGALEILQLWLNLPAKYKMVEPFYKGLQKDEIPSIEIKDGVKLQLISGEWEGRQGAFSSITEVYLYVLDLYADKEVTFTINTDRNVFFYVIAGHLSVNGSDTEAFHLVEFDNDHTEIHIKSYANTKILFGHAQPINEPLVAQGPFVMNTTQEIEQAYADYKNGYFGTWKH